MEPLVDFALAIQPMVHVERLAPAIAFYESLGGKLQFGSRDGDWALIAFGGTHLSLLAHPPSPDNPEPVELQFTSGTPLEEIEEHLQKTAPQMIARGTGDEAFGRMLQLRTAEGLIIKILELERDLIT